MKTKTREFLSRSSASRCLFVLMTGVVLAFPAQAADRISPAAKAVRDKINLRVPDGCSHIYGFNYQPSWGYNGLTVWGKQFDPVKYRAELALGKKHFPKFNAVRIWLSWSAYRENPKRFVRNFQKAVDICADLDLLVMPVLLNRWIGSPVWDRVTNAEILADFDKTFMPFIKDVVVPLKSDPRILAWDLCNEPYITDNQDEKVYPVSKEVETQWLGTVRTALKQCDPNAVVCIGLMPGIKWLEMTCHLQDILTTHQYYPLYLGCRFKKSPSPLKDSHVKPDQIDAVVKMGTQLGKAILVTECCWGAYDDPERVSIIRTNLKLLKQNKIGFFPHALWTSGVADLHRYPYKDGICMAFILEDGSIRPGHEVYNEFAK